MAQIGDYQGLCAEYEEDIAGQKKEIEQLKEMLDIYGEHRVGCECTLYSTKCTCGFEQALKGE